MCVVHVPVHHFIQVYILCNVCVHSCTPSCVHIIVVVHTVCHVYVSTGRSEFVVPVPGTTHTVP